MWKLARYLKHFKLEVILGPICKLTEAIFELIIPLVTAKIIDVGIKNNDINYIYRMGLIMLGLGAFGLMFALVCQYVASKASQGVGTMLRRDLFSHINMLSHAEIDELGTSSLVNRITNDVNQLQVAVAMLIRLVVRAPFLAVGATIMAMSINLKLSIIFLVAGFIVALILYLVMKKSIPFYKTIQKKLDRIGLITRENLEGARVIRAFSKQDAQKKRFEAANEDHAAAAIKVGKLSAMLSPMTFAVMNFAILAIIYFGGIEVDSGTMSQGEIIALVNYITQILLALIVVANLVVIFTKAGASAARVNEVFETLPSIVEAKSNTADTKPEVSDGEDIPKVEFRNVSFGYGKKDANSDYAIEQVTVCVNCGETVGVIGATGSGKSTFVNLIPRFYEVNGGEVLVDGINVKNYTFAKLRGQVGFVHQKAVLFHGTIAENLRWANENATSQQMEKALDIAQAREFVDRLPDGINTLIEQGAKNISGGQKQRLTIARALLGNPEILILDDSASALDFVTERKLRQQIKAETTDMTVFIVSQRASSIRYADKIIVFDDGKIVGIGKHKNLLVSCEVYREICLSQLSEAEVYGA